jgi:hypothetical protein
MMLDADMTAPRVVGRLLPRLDTVARVTGTASELAELPQAQELQRQIVTCLELS